MKKTADMQATDHQVVLEQNIRLHETEAYFYNATHPEDFNVFEQKRLKHQVRKLAMEAGPSLPVLDLASGTGNVSDHLKTAGLKPIACDLSLDMLRENRAEYRVRCDITRLPFKEGCFGAVTAYSVFHHLPDPTGTMEEVGRVAAEQCVLYFDHDHFLPHDSRTLGDYPFTVSDLLGWVPWLVLHPKHLRRLFQYALWGRKVHLRNIRGLDQAESHERVEPERLVKILEGKGFHVQPGRHRGGSYLKAWRGKDLVLKSYYKTREGAEEQSSGTERFILQIAELVRTMLHERFQPRRILDVGCAGGELVSVWRKHGVEASGVDISDYAINHPRDAKIARHLHVVDVDCERLPFDDDSFDGATALEVLEHLRQPSFLLSELGRVVRDDGFVFVTTPAIPFEKKLWRTLGIQSNPMHINVHSKRFWVKFFGKHCFGYYGELRSFIRESNTFVPADAPLQHWVLRTVRTKLGRIGERVNMKLKCLVHAALLFQNHKDKKREIGSCTDVPVRQRN